MTPSATSSWVARPPALLFGVAIADVTIAEALDSIGEMITLGRERGVTHQVATVNLDFLVNAFGDEELAEILRGADLCLADGAPVLWMAKALGMPIAERVAGSDLVPLLFDRSMSLGWKILVFGPSADVAHKAAQLIESRYPGASVAFESGPMISNVVDVGADVIAQIAEADADVVCVALGNPKQERFIAAHRDRIGAPVMIGIGGSIDMLVGERKRAPSWMRRIGMEWLARAVQEPRRLGPRYAHDVRVMGPRFAGELRANRRRRNDGGLSLEIADGTVRLTVAGDRLPGIDLWRRSVELLRDPDRSDVELVLDPAGAESISDAAAAHLVGLVGVARRAGRPIAWAHDAPRLVASLEKLRVGSMMVGIDEDLG